MARRLIINYVVRRRERIGAALGADIRAKGSRTIVRHKASTAPFLAAARIVDVLVPVALDQSYSYRVPAGLNLAPGDVVWVAGYTLSSRGMVLRMALRMGEHLGPERIRIGVRLAGPAPPRMTAARGRVCELLADGMVRPKGEAAREAGVSVGVIDGLVDEGTLETLPLPPAPVARPPDPLHRVPDLSEPQRLAADALRASVTDGVTGSGKTEVYFEAIAAALARRRQILILMPEIALTGQFLDRFAERFGIRPAEWHSQIAPRLRARTWAAVAANEVSVVAGARSALFLPFADLGLIILDEEHDAAYKQEDGVHYHARDMAVVRARIGQIPIVLSSATPSVETEVNARRNRYRRLSLPERFGGQQMPVIEAIDLTREGPARGRFIAPRLAEAVNIALERKEQALLFLNRRGYAPLTLCRACGFRLSCPHCDAWLVDHRFRRQLVCHHCGFATPQPTACPKCQATDSFTACGPGVERIEEEAATLFPQARILVLSSDLIATVERMRQELNEIAEGRVDLIIGTQLVAKGHHFPKLNLVGIVDADLGMSNGDPRAAERTFQLLHQVSGRAGREGRRGHGYLQTHQPNHPVMKALIAGDREAFYGTEIAARESAGYPPFGRLASLVISAGTRPGAEGFARNLARTAPHDETVRVLGPAEAPLAVVRGRHRFRLLVKTPRAFDLSAYLRDWLAAAPKPKGDIRLEVDIDPQSFL